MQAASLERVTGAHQNAQVLPSIKSESSLSYQHLDDVVLPRGDSTSSDNNKLTNDFGNTLNVNLLQDRSMGARSSSFVHNRNNIIVSANSALLTAETRR